MDKNQEQLNEWIKERDAVLASLYLNKKENDRLINNNTELASSVKTLESKIVSLTKETSDLIAKNEERRNLLLDVASLKADIQKLSAVKSDLNKTILQIQNDPQILSLSGTRDKVQAEVSALLTERDNLIIKNKELAASNTDIQIQLSSSLARLDESTKKEEEFNQVIGVQNSELTTLNTSLETKRVSLVKEIALLEDTKQLQLHLIDMSKTYKETVDANASSMEKVVGHVVSVSTENMSKLERLLESVTKSTKEVIEINGANVEKANQVIAEMPRAFFELQRQTLERRKFNK